MVWEGGGGGWRGDGGMTAELVIFRFLGSKLDLIRFLWSLRHPTSSHGEGEGGSSRGPGDEEGHAAGDEGPEGHEVSWELLRLVRSGSLVRRPAPVCGCLHTCRASA